MLLLGLKSTNQTLINKRVLSCVNFRFFFLKELFSLLEQNKYLDIVWVFYAVSAYVIISL